MDVTKEVELLRAENTKAAKKIEEMAYALSMVQMRWTFDNNQQHTHTWRDWADCQPAITKALGMP